MKFYEIPRPFGQDISNADREQQQEQQDLHGRKICFRFGIRSKSFQYN